MNILLSGATGFVGRNFIKYAVRKGHKVYAMAKKKQTSIKNVTWLIGSLKKKHKEFKKCDVLIHLAAAGVNKKIPFKKLFQINVIDSGKLFMNVARSGCTNWVVIGSSSEYGKSLQHGKPISAISNRVPCDNYGKSKSIFSDYVKILTKIFKAKCRVLRLFPVYGLDENKKRLFASLNNAIINKKNFIVKNPNEIRDFSNINDIVKKILKSIYFSKTDKNFEQRHLASGKALKVIDFVRFFCKKKKYNGKIICLKNTKMHFHHISDKKSIW
jgi:nucleoside-diphosphate-sugar epimerase